MQSCHWCQRTETISELDSLRLAFFVCILNMFTPSLLVTSPVLPIQQSSLAAFWGPHFRICVYVYEGVYTHYCNLFLHSRNVLGLHLQKCFTFWAREVSQRSYCAFHRYPPCIKVWIDVGQTSSAQQRCTHLTNSLCAVFLGQSLEAFFLFILTTRIPVY